MGHNLHHDHVSNPNVHLPGMTNVGAVEVTHLPLENCLSVVNTRVVSHLNHSVVDLPHVNLVKDGVSFNTTFAALLRLTAPKFFPVGRSIEDVEDVAKHGGTRKFDPVEFRAGVEESIMSCFWLISTSTSDKLVDEGDSVVSVGEILSLDDVGVSMVSIGDHSESESDTFRSNFVFYLFDERGDS